MEHWVGIFPATTHTIKLCPSVASRKSERHIFNCLGLRPTSSTWKNADFEWGILNNVPESRHRLEALQPRGWWRPFAREDCQIRRMFRLATENHVASTHLEEQNTTLTARGYFKRHFLARQGRSSPCNLAARETRPEWSWP